MGGEQVGGEGVLAAGGEPPPVQGAFIPVECVEQAGEGARASGVVAGGEVGQGVDVVEAQHEFAQPPHVIGHSGGAGGRVRAEDRGGSPA